MMIRLQRQRPPFPRMQAEPLRDNAWGSQWKHLPRAPLRLMRNAMRDSLRILRG
jgi:hypothetical protein